MSTSDAKPLLSKRKTPRQGRAKATVAAILEATAQVLVERGYNHLTTSRVADRAGVSVGSLYQYFPSKQSLVAALAEQTLDHALAAMTAAARSQGDARQRFEATIDALLAVKGENPALSLVLPASYLEVAGREGLAAMLAGARGIVEELIEDAVPELTQAQQQQAAFAIVHGIDGVIDGALRSEDVDLSAPWLRNALLDLTLGYMERVRIDAAA